MATQAKPSKERMTPSQARSARRARKKARKRLLRYGGLGLIGFISALFIVALFLPGLPFANGRGGLFGGGAPTGPGTRVSDQGQTHIAFNDDHPPFNSVPATSGWHYGQPLAPVRWGVHDSVVADEYRIHNLEHGGIGIHYDCPEGCPETVAQLADIVDRGVDGGLKILLSPYPGMDSKIALTAWTFIQKLDEFDDDLVKDFIESHESSPNAPEANAR
ncbi:MAG: DUF3105 domain-containing protein [Chloroflexi bacterium]|nr:DUF3105 domain-containing protein [Chloroflexota bacterium]